MLKALRIVGIPCANRAQKFAQIVYMPMFGFSLTKMPGHARLDTTGPKCAADINVVPHLEIYLTPSAYLGDGFRTTSQNERVRSGIRSHCAGYGGAIPGKNNSPLEYSFPKVLCAAATCRIAETTSSSDSDLSG